MKKVYVFEIKNNKSYPQWLSREGYKIITADSKEKAVEMINDPELDRSCKFVAEYDSVEQAYFEIKKQVVQPVSKKITPIYLASSLAYDGITTLVEAYSTKERAYVEAGRLVAAKHKQVKIIQVNYVPASWEIDTGIPYEYKELSK